MVDLHGPIVIFSSDQFTKATLALVTLWLLVTFLQCWQVILIIANSHNVPRRRIFGTLLGGVMCLLIAYGSRIGQIVLDNSVGGLAYSPIAEIVLYSINVFAKTGYIVVLLSIFLASYHRAAQYVGPSSRAWSIKKVADGLFLAIWALVYVVKIAWYIAAYVTFYINSAIGEDEYDEWQSTPRSLQSAIDALFVLVEVDVIVGILMLHRFCTVLKARDYVVRTLMWWTVPCLVLRSIWNSITTALYNIRGIIDPHTQIERLLLADWIIDDLLSVIVIGTMIRLGSRDAAWFWDTPAIPALPVLPPGPVQHQPQIGR